MASKKPICPEALAKAEREYWDRLYAKPLSEQGRRNLEAVRARSREARRQRVDAWRQAELERMLALTERGDGPLH